MSFNSRKLQKKKVIKTVENENMARNGWNRLQFGMCWKN